MKEGKEKKLPLVTQVHNLKAVNICFSFIKLGLNYADKIVNGVSGCRVLTTDEVIECNFLLDGLMILTNNWILGY